MTRGRKITSKFMNYNDKVYEKGSTRYKTKEEALKNAKRHRKNGYNIILDKRKSGYFFWVDDKPKSKKKKEILKKHAQGLRDLKKIYDKVGR